MTDEQREILDRVRNRVARLIDKGGHELPIFDEEYQAMCDAGMLKPDQELYRFLTIKRLKS